MWLDSLKQSLSYAHESFSCILSRLNRWGINPLRFRTEEENDPQYRAFYNDWKEEIHKAASIPLYTSTFYAAPHLTTFKVEQDGMVAYDVKTFGRFAIIIVKIDKQTGKECGEL